MGLQGLIRLILPKEDHFYAFLERQATAARDAAKAFAAFKDGKTAAAVRDAVQEFEHEGDKIVHEMEEALAKTFVTPIDREDLQSLSSVIDDVIDLTNYAARASALYGIDKPSPAMVKLSDVLVRCTEAINATMPNLRKHGYPAIIEDSHKVRTLEKEADAIFREAVSALFGDATIDARVLMREKEVLQDLETAVNHCQHVADRLTNLAVKHG
jgi:uncharacterized protein Yka (UPF0111/DUF47 family)